MKQDLMELAASYREAGDAIHDAVRRMVQEAGGFLNCSNNKGDKRDMLALVYNSKKGYSESFPIRALRVNPQGEVEVYVGTPGTIYTDKYLRGSGSEERWTRLKDSNVLFFQTILSIAGSIEDYLS